jgi:hypothetical protein
MKIIVALFSVSLFSLFTGFVEFKQNVDCTHCKNIIKYESSIYTDENQPKPYLHDVDSTFMVYPILDNSDISGKKYIKDIKFIYKDKHYCSDQSKITIVNKNGKFSVNSLKRMSCKIISYIRFNKEQSDILSTIPTQKVIIENLVTDNIYEFQLKDSLYFINAYKMQDSNLSTGQNTKFSPKKIGQVK